MSRWAPSAWLRWPFRRRRTANGFGRRTPPARPRRFRLGAVERPKPRRQRAIPWRRIATTLSVLTLLGGIAYGGAWLYFGDTLRVRTVNVVGAEVTDARVVAGVAALGGESLLTLDTADAVRRLETLAAVKSASIRRTWPDGVEIEVVEHQGWGYWQVGDERAVIDADGMVLEASRPPKPGAVTIIEIGASQQPVAERRGITADPDTVRLVRRMLEERAFAELGVRPTGFIFRHDRGLTVLAEGAPAAVFGDSSHYEFKLAAWGELLERIRQESLEVAEIDLRFGRNVVLR